MLKWIAEKTAASIPGVIGSILSFIFKAAASVTGFIAEQLWVLLLFVGAFIYKWITERE